MIDEEQMNRVEVELLSSSSVSILHPVIQVEVKAKVKGGEVASLPPQLGEQQQVEEVMAEVLQAVVQAVAPFAPSVPPG